VISFEAWISPDNSRYGYLSNIYYLAILFKELCGGDGCGKNFFRILGG